MEPAEEDIEPARVRRSPARIVRELVIGSALGWAATAVVAAYLSHRNHVSFSARLPGTAFVMGFVVAFIGFTFAFNPDNVSPLLRDRWLRAQMRIKVRGGLGGSPPGGISRRATNQEASGGISPGTIAFLVTTQLLVYGWFASR